MSSEIILLGRHHGPKQHGYWESDRDDFLLHCRHPYAGNPGSPSVLRARASGSTANPLADPSAALADRRCAVLCVAARPRDLQAATLSHTGTPDNPQPPARHTCCAGHFFIKLATPITELSLVHQ